MRWLGYVAVARECAWLPGAYFGETDAELADVDADACARAAKKRLAWYANFYPGDRRCVVKGDVAGPARKLPGSDVRSMDLSGCRLRAPGC